MINDGFFGEMSIKRNVPKDEQSILEDFSSNIEIRMNGELFGNKKSSPSILNNKNDDDFNPINDDTPIDPEIFFRGSLKGII